jgi:hypothetical protein
VNGTSPSAIALSWGQPGTIGFSNYTVAASTVGPTGPWVTEGVIATEATTLWSTGSLTPGAPLWWEVTASGGLFGPVVSNVVANVQPQVADLTYTLPTGSSADFNWTNNASYGGALGFVDYGLFEEVGGGAPSLVASLPTVGSQTFTATGLSGGLGYSFYVNTSDCYAGCGTGGASLSVTESNPVTFGVAVPLTTSVSDVRSVVDTGQPDLFGCNPSGGQAPYLFSWDFGNGTLVNGTETESVAFASSGSPTIHCDVTDGAHTVATAATSVTVDAAPVVNVTSLPGDVDVGEAVALSCVPSLGTPAFTISWTFGDGTIGSNSPVDHTYATAGPEVVTCSVTDATTTTVLRSLTVPVSPRLSVVAKTSAAAAAPGTSLSLSADVTNGSGTLVSSVWTLGDGGHANGVDVTHSFASAGVFNASVLVTDSNGGTNRSSVSIRVSPVVVQLTQTSTSGRTSQPLAFAANASGGAGGPYNYSWSFGDGSTGFGASVQHAYPSAGTFHPTLLVTDRLGATNRSTGAPVSITVPPPPPPLVPLWAVVGLLLLVLLLVGLLAYRAVRRRRSAALRAAAPWAPPTDPSRTLLGRKNCPTCGASNLPIRETCENCGADLPRRSTQS